MEKKDVLAALAALSQETRLDIFRLLVEAGPEGRAVGRIGEALDLPSSTLSFHVKELKHAGLVTVRREGRSLIYMASFSTMTGLIEYLTRHCCAGDPAACGIASPTAAARKETMTATIYHNPNCGTSRNVLALIRNSSEEPEIIDYLKTPPSRERLLALIAAMGISVRGLLRRKGTPYDELGLDDPKFTDDELIDLMLAHPILINRPIVETSLGTRLCRPSKAVLEILPNPQQGEFRKEDGEFVVDAQGRPAKTSESAVR